MRTVRIFTALVAVLAIVTISGGPAQAANRASFTFDFTDVGDLPDGPGFAIKGSGVVDDGGGCDAVVMVMVDPTGLPLDVDTTCLSLVDGTGTNDGDYGSFGASNMPTASPVTYALFDLDAGDLAALTGLGDSDQAYLDYVLDHTPCRTENYLDETDLAIPTARPRSLCAKIPSFTDVPTSHPFYPQIEWLAAKKVIGGYADGSFQPTATVSRQAMASFLYKAAGSPAFAPPATPTFSDVPTSNPFFKQIEWAAKKGITSGFPDGTFQPTATVSRQAAAKFLFKFAKPVFVPPATATFSDVPTTNVFFKEIEWAASAGITSGFPDGTFRPTNTVSRQAAASFIFQQLLPG